MSPHSEDHQISSSAKTDVIFVEDILCDLVCVFVVEE